MKYKYILFDLDGTLTDPVEGITNSVAYALNKMGHTKFDIDTLKKFIGPPLKDSFMQYFGFTEAKADQAILYYREYFKAKGIDENQIYDGIVDMLSELHDRGKVLIVATSKPTVFAETILKNFDIAKYFTCVMGSNLDGSRTRKADVIEAALGCVGITDYSQAVMIGDREHDIIGAKAVGIDSIGVAYGYGSYEELEKAEATRIVGSVLDLKILLAK